MNSNLSIEHLLAVPASFLAASDGPGANIAISSRIRLARNIKGYPFPGAASASQAREVCELVSEAASFSGSLPCPDCLDFSIRDLKLIDREILFERRLASRELIESPENTRLLVRKDESCSVMINEEDQIRMQSIRPGFQLQEVFREINRIDDELSCRLDYAFDEQLGFLTSCPTNVGTGMRASVMLHLPGLVITGQIAPTIQGISKLNLAVRGIFGEGSDNRGNLFQISNQSTLGESEENILSTLSAVIEQLVFHEKRARQTLLKDDRYGVLDYIGRSYGILRHCYKLSGEEALKSLSGVRLGVDLGLFNSVDISKVNELFIATGAAHLQANAGVDLSSDERDIRRAQLCREKLKL